MNVRWGFGFMWWWFDFMGWWVLVVVCTEGEGWEGRRVGERGEGWGWGESFLFLNVGPTYSEFLLIRYQRVFKYFPLAHGLK